MPLPVHAASSLGSTEKVRRAIQQQAAGVRRVQAKQQGYASSQDWPYLKCKAVVSLRQQYEGGASGPVEESIIRGVELPAEGHRETPATFDIGKPAEHCLQDRAMASNNQAVHMTPAMTKG